MGKGGKGRSISSMVKDAQKGKSSQNNRQFSSPQRVNTYDRPSDSKSRKDGHDNTSSYTNGITQSKGTQGTGYRGNASEGKTHQRNGFNNTQNNAFYNGRPDSTSSARPLSDFALRKQSYAAGEKIANGEPVWNFAFGANVNPTKLQKVRGIHPLDIRRGKMVGWNLVFRHRGGFGTIEKKHPESQQDSVHGLLLKLKPEDFATLCSMEHQYTAVEVTVDLYSEDVNKAGGDAGKLPAKVKARAFITENSEFLTVAKDLPPTERYIKLIREGAKWSNLEKSYVDWLFGIKGVNGQRGEEYYNCGGTKEPPKSPRASPRNVNAANESPTSTPCNMNASNESMRSATQSTRISQPKTGILNKWSSRGPHQKFNLRSPTGVCATESHVYIADAGNNRVLRVPLEDMVANDLSHAEVVAGGFGKGSTTWQLNRPFRIFVKSDAKSKDILYIVDRNNNRIMRWVVGEDEGTVVAGGNGAGYQLNQLDQPCGVHVHANDLYIADRANHRILRWRMFEKSGVIVAGGNGYGSRPDQLMCPGSVFVANVEQNIASDVGVEQKVVMLVTDEGNNRLQMFEIPGKVPSNIESSQKVLPSGVTVAGQITPGGGSAELYHPLGISCSQKSDHVNSSHSDSTPSDSILSVYISDSLNYRVQRFDVDIRRVLDKISKGIEVKPMLGRTVIRHGHASNTLGQPISVVVVNNQHLFVADSENNKIVCKLLDAITNFGGDTKSGTNRPIENPESILESFPLSTLTDEDLKVRQGIVVEYRHNSGFGFIKHENLKYFAHHSDIMAECPLNRKVKDEKRPAPSTGGYPFLRKNERVQFCSRRDSKWGQRATCIARIENMDQ